MLTCMQCLARQCSSWLNRFDSLRLYYCIACFRQQERFIVAQVLRMLPGGGQGFAVKKCFAKVYFKEASLGWHQVVSG